MITTITYALFFLFIAAGLHLIYETALAPSFRMALRFRVFALRDELRRLKDVEGEKISDEAFDILDHGLCWQLANQRHFDCGTFAKGTHAIHSSKELQEKVAKTRAIIGGCEVDAFRKIDHESAKLLSLVMIINSGGWLIYMVPTVVPMVVLVMLFGRLVRFAANLLAAPPRVQRALEVACAV